jgi:hypothetical protein
MTLGEQIKAIREANEKLKALLDNEQPGLFTWCAAVGRALNEIAAYAPSGRKS